MKIVPAILAETPELLAKQAARVIELSDLFHLDVADGRFVDLLTPEVAQYPKLANKKKAFWHLMVENPLDYIEDCLRQIETEIIAIHAEAKKVTESLAELRRLRIDGCLVINPYTSVKDVLKLLTEVKMVQIMTVIPGAQGREFLPAELAKISLVAESQSDLLVAVDGGINRDTIEKVKAYRPDLIAVGSGLQKSADPVQEYQLLRRLVAS